MRNFLLVAALVPLSVALAADPPAAPDLVERVENADIPLEELVYSFLFTGSLTTQILNGRISQAGIDLLNAERALHEAGMRDTRKHVARLRQVCADLKSAGSSQEFAAVFVKGEAKEREENRQAARRVLSQLEPEDRKVVEAFVDTRYRRGYGRSTLDYQALFASETFPSDKTNAATQKVCEAGATGAQSP